MIFEIILHQRDSLSFYQTIYLIHGSMNCLLVVGKMKKTTSQQVSKTT